MLVIFALLSLMGIAVLLFGAAALERLAGDRLVVDMRNWTEDSVALVPDTALESRRAA